MDIERRGLNTKQAMFQMNAEEPLDDVKKSLGPVIKYYESIKKKYSSNSKADRKMRYASYFNLAKIYYYLDEPDAAMREAGELSMNEYDEKDGKRLEAMATELKTILKLNKFHSRHFASKSKHPGSYGQRRRITNFVFLLSYIYDSLIQ